MLKKILALVAALYAVASFAAVDVNKATAADLDGIKGVGPSLSTKILDERKKGNFKDWNDFIERTRGVGEGNAAKFSAEGLTVNGSSFKGAAATSAATPKDGKPIASADQKKTRAEERKERAEAKKLKADEAKSDKPVAKDAAAKAETIKPAVAATTDAAKK
ncbi:MAG TPA: helix-hairpin-helix domain-containing protein [Burkholderiaceae bacterium]|nr:helix-hairpin-helix domain-containing protein [Burkholderiaceae bacterium]